MKYRSLIYASCMLAILLMLSGCNRGTCTLAGHVTFQNKPLTNGSVILFCENQQIVRGVIANDGSYSIPNVPRGLVRVTVTPVIRLPEGYQKKYDLPPVINGPVIPQFGSSDKGQKLTPIPDRYSVPEESGIAVKVDQPVTAFDIHLVR